MSKTLLPLLAVIVLVAGAAAIPAQEEAAPAKVDQAGANAQKYVLTMVGFMSSPDPRMRYSVREAMTVMGPQAISAINGAKAKEKNPQVKAFMTRTVTFIKSRQSRQRGQRGQRGSRQRTIDIDRIAMDANLTWEQMDKVLPVLKKSQKDQADLMTEFREAGGNFRDREALADLREEMSAIAKEAEPKLKEFLNETQVKQMRRHINPWGDRMNRTGGRGGRGERGNRAERGNRGEGGERRRPPRGEGGGGGERPVR